MHLAMPFGASRHVENSTDAAISAYDAAHGYRAVGFEVAREAAMTRDERRRAGEMIEKTTFLCHAREG